MKTILYNPIFINPQAYYVFPQLYDIEIGIIRIEDESRRFLKGAIYYFALYNKSLTPEEIETEKERLNEEWLKRKN